MPTGSAVPPTDAHPAPRPVTSLPPALTSFVGREHEVETIASLLGSGGARLVTLTGPAGVGKTRLALAVGECLMGQFADREVFVDLAPVLDPALVVGTIAHTLGVRES